MLLKVADKRRPGGVEVVRLDLVLCRCKGWRDARWFSGNGRRRCCAGLVGIVTPGGERALLRHGIHGQDQDG
jgi:hypothetical protein